MKCSTVLIAALATCVVPGFAGESVVHKTPFYRPHSSARVKSAQTRQTADAVIVNSASYESGISPGGLATIFGNNLSTVTGVVLANTNPLPTNLAGVEVLVSGFSAPIYSVAYSAGQDQISIQVPYEAPTGPGAAEIQVYDEGMLVADFFADSFTEDPGISPTTVTWPSRKPRTIRSLVPTILRFQVKRSCSMPLGWGRSH
jgi:hypothetical protein